MKTFLEYMYLGSTVPIVTEGLIVDELSKTLTYTNKNNDVIDSSIHNNPLVKIIKVNGVDVTLIHLFQRNDVSKFKQSSFLIRALKSENGWKIVNSKAMYRDFVNIVRKFNKDEFDTLMYLPSSSVFNSMFSKRIGELLSINNLVHDFMYKLSADDIWEMMVNDGFDRINCNEDEKQIIYSKLHKIFDKMINTDNIFRYRSIPEEYRKYICSTCRLDNHTLSYADDINEKHLLLVDDSYVSGKTVNDAVSVICDSFTPTSITVLTVI